MLLSFLIIYEVLWDVVDLKISRGCRQLKRENTEVPAHMSLARFARVVTLLLLLLLLYRCCTARMLSKFRQSVRWDRPSLCSGWHAHILRTHTEAPFVAVTKRRPSNAAAVEHGCHNVNSLRCGTGTQQQQTTHVARMETRKPTSPLFLRLLCFPCSSYCARFL